jgi:transposase-like protein
MKALILQIETVVCPACRASNPQVFRRRPKPNRIVEYVGRCTTCSRTVTWQEDKCGKLIKP